MTARTKVFRDEYGNRCIFPKLIILEDAEAPSASDVILEAMSLGMHLKLEVEEDWFEFDPHNLPHVRAHATHSKFLFGAATVLVFEGPKFQEILEEIRGQP